MKVILLLSAFMAETYAEKSKTVIVSGSLATDVDWNDELIKHSIIEKGYIDQTELYRTTAAKAKADLEILLTKSTDVDSASVDITDFTEIPGTTNSNETTPSKAKVNFEAALGVPDTKTSDEIDNSVTDAVQNANSTDFVSFDAFDDFEVTVTEQAKETKTETETIPITLTRSYGNTPSDEQLQKTVAPPNRTWKHLSQLEDGKILIYWSDRVRFLCIPNDSNQTSEIINKF